MPPGVRCLSMPPPHPCPYTQQQGLSGSASIYTATLITPPTFVWVGTKVGTTANSEAEKNNGLAPCES